MNILIKIIASGFTLMAFSVTAQHSFQTDGFEIKSGKLEITFIGHGTLMCTHGDKVIHIDPVGSEADYTKMPKADLILITHEHGDHLDADAVKALEKESTKILLTEACRSRLGRGTVMKNGDKKTVFGLTIEAVPAYNLVHKRGNGTPFHVPGSGNGYILTIGGKRLYIAGDTENIPEMDSLKDIDIAFLPMNLPYTMSPEMAAEAARRFRPSILYPYHYGSTDPELLVKLLKDMPEIDVRIRKLQ